MPGCFATKPAARGEPQGFPVFSGYLSLLLPWGLRDV